MAADEPHSALGRVGRYQLLEPIASGGMGAVYLARLSGQLGFEKLLAIKVLLPEISRDRRFVEMFLDEARIAARLSHANVCEIFELGEADGRHFIAMQYLRGVPMTEVLRTPPADRAEHIRLVASIVAQACEGLHHAHELCDEAGAALAIVHRDVSPPNLFVTVDGVVKVLDFGIAKARDIESKTRRDEVKGKQSYMSPEQLAGQPLDRASDIFSLGIILYEGITSTRLFARGTDFLVARAILEEPIEDPRARRPEVSEALAAVTLRALARDRNKRFATARAFGEALSAAISPPGPLATSILGQKIAARFAGAIERDAARVERATTSTFRPAARANRSTARPVTTRARLGALIAVLVVGALLAALAAVTLGKRSSEQRVEGSTAIDASSAVAVSPLPADAAPQEPDAAPRDAGVRVARTPADRGGLDEAAGSVSIDSTPYATIYIDGKRIGPTPIINHAVKPGRRRIRAVAPTGKTQSFTIRVRPGERAPAKILTW